MCLDDEIDPAEAARHLLETLLPGASNAPTALAAQTAVELEEVARFPRKQLLAPGSARSIHRRRA